MIVAELFERFRRQAAGGHSESANRSTSSWREWRVAKFTPIVVAVPQFFYTEPSRMSDVFLVSMLT